LATNKQLKTSVRRYYCLFLGLVFSLYCGSASSDVYDTSSDVYDTSARMNKNRIRQLSKRSSCANFYEKKGKYVNKRSKSLGFKVPKKCRGTVYNYVELNRTKVGQTSGYNVGSIKVNKYSNKAIKTNIGVVSDCKKPRKIINIIAVRDSKVGNASIGSQVNSGVKLVGCKGALVGVSTNNNVKIIGASILGRK